MVVRSSCNFAAALCGCRLWLALACAAAVLQGKHLGNLTMAERLFARALDIDAGSVEARQGYMHCHALLNKALLHDDTDADLHRFVYNATNIAPPPSDDHQHQSRIGHHVPSAQT